tara:strand:- start:4479 stop:5204 length:726 start_codon:yes stop_codon:yes gene_type:complete
MKNLTSKSLLFFVMAIPVYTHADDNEIMIQQSGDTLTLYIDQVGYGNKIGQDDYSQGGSDMTITGTELTFDLDMIGNTNKIYGPIIMDRSDLTFNLTGDSNEVDWNIGYTGSSDDSNYNFMVTGDSNTFDIDQGYVGVAERLDADLILVGSFNTFDLDFESSDNRWVVDMIGDGNNVNTLQNDSDQILIIDYVGDYGDIDINQISGTCGIVGMSCTGIIDMDITSDNATIQINQQDSSSDN